MKLEITKGNVSAHNQKGIKGHCILAQVFDVNGKSLAHFASTETEFESSSNANLYADAHNTYNKCETLPSELLKQNEALVECLKKVICDGQTYLELLETINKSKGLLNTLNK